MRAGLVTNTYLEATAIRQYKKRYSEYVVTEELKERIAECATPARADPLQGSGGRRVLAAERAQALRVCVRERGEGRERLCCSPLLRLASPRLAVPP